MQKAPAHRIVFHPKDWDESFPIICGGWAAYSAILPTGSRQILAFLLDGDLVATSWVAEPAAARTIEALTDVSYRKFSRRTLRELLLNDSHLQEEFLRIASNELQQAERATLMLHHRHADARIAALIMYLSEKLAARGRITGQAMEFPLRHRDIADATGLTSDHVGKVLTAFQRAKLMKISKQSLLLLNQDELERLV